MPTSVNMAYFPDTRLLATYEVEGVAAQYVNFANVPMLGGAEMEPPTTAPSRSAPVELVAEGSFTRPETDHESVVGKVPTTLAFLVAGSIPTT